MSPNRTYTAVLEEAVDALENAGVEMPRRTAEWLLMALEDTGRAQIYTDPDRKLSVESVHRFRKMVERRVQREPLQYILGEAEFFGRTFDVTPAVLIPRPETERLVEVGLELLTDKVEPSVLDVGTGSGCIAVTMAIERSDARVAAVDVSTEALAVARRNARSHGVSIDFREVDVVHDAVPPESRGVFDLVISNPPYIPADEAGSLDPEVVDHEPAVALFTPDDDPMSYVRAVADKASRYLTQEGQLALEVHAPYSDRVTDLLSRRGWAEVTCLKDLAGRSRVVTAVDSKGQEGQ